MEGRGRDRVTGFEHVLDHPLAREEINLVRVVDGTPVDLPATPALPATLDVLHTWAVPSSAKQCQAVPSSAEQCRAVPSSAEQCQTP